MTSRPPDVAVLITGFPRETGIDRFIMAEIRYFKSMEMQVNRCEGQALRFDFQDLDTPLPLFGELSRRYPDLRFLVDDGVRTVALEGGREQPVETGRVFADHRPVEEIYATF